MKKFLIVMVASLLPSVLSAAEPSLDRRAEEPLVRIVEAHNGRIVRNDDTATTITIWYSPRLDPESLTVKIDGVDITQRLSPRPNYAEFLTIYEHDVIKDGEIELSARAKTANEHFISAQSNGVDASTQKYQLVRKQMFSSLEAKIDRKTDSVALDRYAEERGLSTARSKGKEK